MHSWNQRKLWRRAAVATLALSTQLKYICWLIFPVLTWSTQIVMKAKQASKPEDKLTQRKGALHKGGQTCGGLLYAGTFQPNSAIFTQVVNTLVVSWSCLFSKYELLHLNREYYHTRHRWCADWPVLGLFWKQQPCSAHTWVPATATEHNSAKKIATRRRYFCTVAL